MFKGREISDYLADILTAKHIPDPSCKKHPDIPWNKILVCARLEGKYLDVRPMFLRNNPYYVINRVIDKLANIVNLYLGGLNVY